MDSSTTIFVSEFSIAPPMAGFTLAIDVKRTEPKDGRYGFEVLAVGEPKPIEDFIADMERPLTPEGLVPAEDDR